MKKRYILTFPAEILNQPFTYQLIKEFDIQVNILKARITSGEEGYLLMGMSGEKAKIDKAIEYLKQKKIKCSTIEKQVIFKQDECIHCGSCTAVCFSGALTMNKESRQLEFNPQKCTVCELCTKACPLSLFEIDFG